MRKVGNSTVRSHPAPSGVPTSKPPETLDPMKSQLVTTASILGLAMALPSQAAIFTLPDITRPAAEASISSHFDFVSNDGWSGSPPNEILNETSVYLKFTVSWAPAANIGTFLVRLNVNDDGSGARIGAGTDGSGFSLINGNSNTDPDGAGPATAKPAVDAVNKTEVTSVTFVIKVDQTKPTPGGDWWFGNTAQQGGAGHFVYINPNLAQNEALQSTKWAAWRSGQNGYEGVSFISDTADVDLNFTNITLYTGDDTPFSTAVAGVDAGTSTVTASPASVPANGITTSTVTVTLRDAGNIPVSGKLVTLAQTAGPGTAVIEPASGTTNLFGVTTFTVKSDTVGTAQFTATGDSVAITQTASVDFASALADAATSTVTASPGKIAANGVAESIVTVTVRNALGMPLVGKLISLVDTAGPGTPFIGPAAIGSETTNASGVATFAVSSETIGTEVFTATVVADSVVIPQTASVEFVDPTIQRGFNVSFVNFTDSVGAFEDPATLVGPAGGSGETWTQIRAVSGSNLLAADGTATGVSVTTTYTECRQRSISGLVMLYDGLTDFGKGLSRSVTISGLEPGGLYDLYLTSTAAFEIASERANGTFSMTNPTSTTGAQTIDQSVAANTTTWTEGNNYVVFRNVVVSGTGQIQVTAADTAGFRLPLNGLQLVPVGRARILSFEAAGSPGVIDQGAFTIDVTVPFGTNLATLAPTFTVNSGTCNQTSGLPPSPTFAAQNPVSYTVTDDSTDPATVNTYTVTVTVAPEVGSLVINLGTSPAGTTIAGGSFGSYTAAAGFPTNLPLPSLPAGSILRSIQVNALLESTDNDNFASDLSLLLDPTPGSPGTDFSVEITNGTAPLGGAALNLNWPVAADSGTGTALVDSKTEAAWSAVGAIDLATTGLFLGNAFGGPTAGGTWSGTITLTYDIVGASPTYASWSGGAGADIDSNNDGVENGVAWALGAQGPNAVAVGLLPVLDNASDPDYVIFEFNRSDDAKNDPATTILVQYGSTLGGWTTAVHDGDNVIISETNGSPKDLVRVRLKRSTLAPAGSIFARLKVMVAAP